MAAGYTLTRGHQIESCGGAALLAHQTDGNVVVYHGGVARWATNTAGLSSASFVMQNDGNLVLYGPANEVRWSAGTDGHAGASAAIQDDCNLVVSLGGSTLWASASQCQ
jgi:hypothetical protein